MPYHGQASQRRPEGPANGRTEENSRPLIRRAETLLSADRPQARLARKLDVPRNRCRVRGIKKYLAVTRNPAEPQRILGKDRNAGSRCFNKNIAEGRFLGQMQNTTAHRYSSDIREEASDNRREPSASTPRSIQPLFGGALAYFRQICGLAFAQEPTSSQFWKYALFLISVKLAEFQGVLKFCWRQWQR